MISSKICVSCRYFRIIKRRITYAKEMNFSENYSSNILKVSKVQSSKNSEASSEDKTSDSDEESQTSIKMYDFPIQMQFLS